MSAEAKIAACLRIIGNIPYLHHLKMGDRNLISLFHFDHDPIPRAEGGPNKGFNLTPRFIGDHKHKTATIDVPKIAKGKRIRAKEAQHKQRMAEK